MFHKAKTEKERQQIFDDYFLGILKDKKVIETNQKIIDESGFSYDPELENNQIKGTFDSYVDTLVIKNYMIEQLQSRLKISKSLATQFVNKLNGNELLILSKNLNEFIKYLEDTYNNINDYILKTSFNVLQRNYNITQQKEKNKEIVKDYQTETGQTINENIPAEQLEQAEEEGMEDEPSSPFSDEEQKLVSFLNMTIFKVKGSRQFSAISTKKILLSEFLDVDPRTYQFAKKINQIFIDELMNIINQRRDEKKQIARIDIQEGLRNAFYRSMSIPDSIKALNDKLFNDKVVGNGYGVVNDPYITIGKYKVHKQHLLGGKLQVRSPVNHNQVYGFKSQNITNNIKDIFIEIT